MQEEAKIQLYSESIQLVIYSVVKSLICVSLNHMHPYRQSERLQTVQNEIQLFGNTVKRV